MNEDTTVELPEATTESEQIPDEVFFDDEDESEDEACEDCGEILDDCVCDDEDEDNEDE